MILTESIELNPDNPNFDNAYYYLGKARISLKQYEEGINDLTKSIELNPDNPNFDNAYYYLEKQEWI